MKMTLIALVTAATLFAAGDFTPPGAPPVKRPKIKLEPENSSRWLLSGDFLYWIPEMEGLKFANRSIPTEKQEYNEIKKKVETVTTYENKTLEVKGDWEPGIRISMGYLFDEKGWDALLNWTYFRNEPSSEIKVKEKENLSPAATPPGTFFATSVDSAKGKWYLIQNGVDLEAGKNFPIGDLFLARPFCGLKGISLRSKTVFQYAIQNQEYSVSAEVPTKSNFIGAGPRLGGNLAYEFGRGLGIFALGSGSMLYGKFDTSFNGEADRNNAYRTVTAMQIQMGAQWKKTFGKKYHVGFLAAWEQNFYSGVNRAIKHLEKSGKGSLYRDDGDLILKGLTASCHLDF